MGILREQFEGPGVRVAVDATHNIEGRPLTQEQLQRVPARARRHVDQFLREVARRLLGRRQGVERLQERFDAASAEQAAAWAQAARYLDGRIQSDPNHKPGRTPDMSPAAAKAMKAVLHEVAGTSGGGGMASPMGGGMMMNGMGSPMGVRDDSLDAMATACGPWCLAPCRRLRWPLGW